MQSASPLEILTEIVENIKIENERKPISNRNHPYIVSAKRWVGGFREVGIFADLQYYLC